jgi:hypothetical protein
MWKREGRNGQRDGGTLGEELRSVLERDEKESMGRGLFLYMRLAGLHLRSDILRQGGGGGDSRR